MATEKTDIYTILIASTLNRQLKQYNLDHGEIVDSKVKLQYNDFINAMNLLIQNWKSKFSTNNVFRDIVIDKTILISSINNSKFADLFTIAPHYLLVEIDDNYEQKITTILSQSIWHCATAMLQHVNELGEKSEAEKQPTETTTEIVDNDDDIEMKDQKDGTKNNDVESQLINEPIDKDIDDDGAVEKAGNNDTTKVIIDTNEIADKMGVEITPATGLETGDDTIVKSSSTSIQEDLLPVDSKDVTNDFLKDADDVDEELSLNKQEVVDPIEAQVEKQEQTFNKIESESSAIVEIKSEERFESEQELEQENIANAEEVENVVNEEQHETKVQEETDESEEPEAPEEPSEPEENGETGLESGSENEDVEIEEPKEIQDAKVQQEGEASQEIDVETKSDSETKDNGSVVNEEVVENEYIKNAIDQSKDVTDEPSDRRDSVDSTGPVKGSHKRKSSTSSTQKHKRFQHIAINLINSIQAHRFSSPFLQAVNKRDASDYYEVIHEPKDLKNILKAVKSKSENPPYESIKQLERDIVLMFANCVMYNKSDDDLVRLTISMKNDVNNIFKMFEEAESDIK